MTDQQYPQQPNQQYPQQPNQPYGQQQSQPPAPSDPQQGHPAQQEPPSSALKFTVQGNVMTTNMIPPTLTIDGFPAPTALGSTMIPIQPGTHRLDVHSQWMRRYGQASLDVAVQPNSVVEVFYASPLHQFTGGSLGFSKQKRRGLPVLLGIVIGLPVLIIAIAVIAALLS